MGPTVLAGNNYIEIKNFFALDQSQEIKIKVRAVTPDKVGQSPEITISTFYDVAATQAVDYTNRARITVVNIIPPSAAALDSVTSNVADTLTEMVFSVTPARSYPAESIVEIVVPGDFTVLDIITTDC